MYYKTSNHKKNNINFTKLSIYLALEGTKIINIISYGEKFWISTNLVLEQPCGMHCVGRLLPIGQFTYSTVSTQYTFIEPPTGQFPPSIVISPALIPMPKHRIKRLANSILTCILMENTNI